MHRLSIPQLLLYCLGICLAMTSTGSAVTLKAREMDKIFGLTPDKVAKGFSVQEIASTSPSNVFWPGEPVGFTLQIVNNTEQPLTAQAKAEIIQYGTVSDPMDGWKQIAHKIADIGAVPVPLNIAAKGFADVVVTLPAPKQFGAYVLILEVPGQGRQFGAAYLSVPKATPGRVQYPTYALDIQSTSEEACALYERLGIKGTRMEFSFSTAQEYEKRLPQWLAEFERLNRHNISVMLCLEGGNYGLMPLGRIRSFLDENGVGKFSYPGDFAWLPQHDPEFQQFVCKITSQFGWPKGPVNSVELWNEPWEGISISGWGADLPRYREIYTHMAQGVEEARAKEKVEVLIGGTCSSMNTEDKLFGDGKDTFLKWLDFNSIHYQPMGNVPALIPAWNERKSPNGPVRHWDTESWIANSEDKVGAVIASMRAQGLSRTAGVLHDVVREYATVQIRTADGKKKPVNIVQAWACGAGIAANQALLGERPFKELLFKNGLPWVFVFDGLPGAAGKAQADDGTLVVVGDLSGVYQREQLKFRDVYGLQNVQLLNMLNAKLAALPATATKLERTALTQQLTQAQTLAGATMTLANGRGAFTLYDWNGNPVPATRGKLTIPLNGLGYFLRTNGKPGSFAKLLAEMRTARIDGLEPLEIQAQDLTARIATGPVLSVTLTNILNRPVTGTLAASLGGLTLDVPAQPLTLAAHETRTLTLKVTGGQANDSNTYPLAIAFNAGKDGTAVMSDEMHVNVIEKRTVTVDGKLDEWTNALPQIVKSSGDSGPSLTEKAWLPMVNFPEKTGTGLTVAYLAYDATNFYFAAKTADTTPDGGQIRFATREDDEYYFPEKSYLIQKDGRKDELTWPAGVRRFTYRKNPDLPFGGDAIQIAFNVLPQEKKGLYPFAPGTMERFMVYKDTDYEYYLHPVMAKRGGGAEIWRLLAPGVPRKHFYPRQPKAATDGGPVEGGKLVVVQEPTTRILESAIPWTELPEVKAALDAGRTIKFTFRVTDDKGPSYDSAANRSVAKWNPLTFHEYWGSTWSNEIPFAFEK